MQSGNNIGKWADCLFDLPLDELDCARVETRACELREVTALQSSVGLVLDAGQINARIAARADDLPGEFEFGGKSQFAGENIHSSQRENAEPRPLEPFRGVANSIEDFIQRAVAAGGDDCFKAFCYSFFSESPRIARSGSELESGLCGNFVEVPPEAPGFVASGAGIENDAGPHALLLWRDTGVSSGECRAKVSRNDII